MYWFLSRLVNITAYIFRVLQFILLIYLIGDVLYWFFALGKSFVADLFAPLYKLPVGAVTSFFAFFKWDVGEKFPLLQLEILLSIFVVLFLLIMSNVLFIFFGSLEKSLVEKAYDTGERDYE